MTEQHSPVFEQKRRRAWYGCKDEMRGEKEDASAIKIMTEITMTMTTYIILFSIIIYSS
jgi:hypothetical protein